MNNYSKKELFDQCKIYWQTKKLGQSCRLTAPARWLASWFLEQMLRKGTVKGTREKGRGTATKGREERQWEGDANRGATGLSKAKLCWAAATSLLAYLHVHVYLKTLAWVWQGDVLVALPLSILSVLVADPPLLQFSDAAALLPFFMLQPLVPNPWLQTERVSVAALLSNALIWV